MSGEIAFDSNRVGHRTQRVFHATWCEMNGHVVWLTPTTAAEIAGSIRLWDVAGSVERLRQEWTQRHNDPTLTKTERYDLLMQQWWGLEWSREDSPYKVLRMTPRELALSERFLERIPARAFRGLTEEEVKTHRDARIICESLGRNVSMLATGNMAKLDHATVNDWAREEKTALGWENAEEDLLKVADSAMVEWSRGREDMLLKVGLAASWPEERTASIDAVMDAFEQRMEAMGGAKLEMTGERLLNLAYAEKSLQTVVEATRERLPEKTRGAERREQRFRRQAIRTM